MRGVVVTAEGYQGYMLDREALTARLSRQVSALEDDLRTRADTDAGVAEVVSAEYSTAKAAGRTSLSETAWRDQLLTQVAVGWVLSAVFVRFCEDNGLIVDPAISGPGARRAGAADAMVLFFREHPEAGDRAYLRQVFTDAAKLPGLDRVLGASNPVWLFGPSDDAARELIGLFTALDDTTGDLVWDFTDPDRSTRFLGDLYQDLSEAARKTFALLQTPDFVEAFILERTLDPALDEFGLDGFAMIDPACGSGHFLLGAFDRLFDRWQTRTPSDGARANAAKALASIHGVDINPFATAIAQFRLLVAALNASNIATLAEAPVFELNVATGDSLLHGPNRGRLGDGSLLGEVDAQGRSAHLFATEDGPQLTRILGRRYHAVVANPPYITPKDPAANAAYRDRWDTCSGKYALSVPFMELIFDLAERGAADRPAGFTGQITANSFMKREFGKKLVGFLANEVDLTHVIDTSGAYLPGHGTPTVILFGLNRAATRRPVRAALGIRGEPNRPADPAHGEVWTSITTQLDIPGAENDYISIVDLDHDRLAEHPWSLQGGQAGPAKALIEETASHDLGSQVDAVGVTAISGEDEAFVAPLRSLRARSVADQLIRRLVRGDENRDWITQTGEHVVFPYTVDSLVEEDGLGKAARWLWPSRTTNWARKTFAKTSYRQEGRTWWEWHQTTLERLATPLTITFAFVATHNHFVLDRGGKVFKQSAPVIKLPARASVDEHLQLLGLLNSSVACFWMKQVFHGKGNGGVNEGYRGDEFEEFFEFDGTKLKQFPIAEGSVLGWAALLDSLATQVAEAEARLGSAPSAEVARSAGVEVAELRARMVGVQEELDWRCLFLYGLTETDLSMPAESAPSLALGERAFEIALARRMAAGEVSSTWFERHGSTPITDLPSHWSDDYGALVERRLELIGSDKKIALLERPEYKRRWNWDSWETVEQRILRGWLLDRLEDPGLWPGAEPRSVAQLADQVRADPHVVEVAQMIAGTTDVDLVKLLGELVKGEAVPYVAALRYKESGLRKRAEWEATWDLQRREDAGDDVGEIPVPPKYTSADFRPGVYPHRGKLDVAKERFVSYPNANRDTDPTLLVGWAGWDHLQQCEALAGLYEERRTRDGWGPEQLTPLLAGIAELVPWVIQWHNDLDPVHGSRAGDDFDAFVNDECARHGIGRDTLAHWRPPASTRGRKKKNP